MSQWNMQIMRDIQMVEPYSSRPVSIKHIGQVFKHLHQNYTLLVKGGSPVHGSLFCTTRNLGLKPGAFAL